MKNYSAFTSMLVLVLLALGAACGAKSTESEGPNNGGRTHFLSSCEADAECGSLACLAKVCTRRCDTDVDCSDLDAAARCDVDVCAVAPASEPAPSPSDAGRADDALSCEELRAPPPDAERMDVRLTNDSGEYLVLDSPFGCAGSVYVDIQSKDSASPGVTVAGQCTFTCDEVLPQPIGCDPSCPGASPLVLDPGETVTVPWERRLATTVTVAPDCCSADYCPTECMLLRIAAPGPHRATLMVATLTEAEATVCRTASTTSPPFPPPGVEEGLVCRVEPDEFDSVTLDFELGSGPVELSIAPPGPDREVSEVCEPLLAPGEGELIDIGVTNRRGEPIALGPPIRCEVDYVTVQSQNDASPGRGLTSSCLDTLTCDRILASDLPVGCPAPCNPTPPIVIEPGERAVVQWRALVETIATVIPECCASEQSCPSECLSPRAAEPGQYSATLAFAPLSETEAELCRGEPEHVDCIAKVNGVELEQVELGFALGQGDVELELE